MFEVKIKRDGIYFDTHNYWLNIEFRGWRLPHIVKGRTLWMPKK